MRLLHQDENCVAADDVLGDSHAVTRILPHAVMEAKMICEKMPSIFLKSRAETKVFQHANLAAVSPSILGIIEKILH